MEIESCVQAENAPVLDDVGHGPQSALILVAGSYSMTALVTGATLGQEHRDLGAEFGELEGAGEEGNCRAGGGTSCAKAGDGI